MGIMTTISIIIIIAIIFITIIGFGAQGRSELYHILRSKLHRGEPTPQGTTGGRGDTMGWGVEGGPSSAAPYMRVASAEGPALVLHGLKIVLVFQSLRVSEYADRVLELGILKPRT